MPRNTNQQRAIRRVLAEAPGPLAPQEVLDRARRHVPRMGLATVYRWVRGLTDEGWLTAVEVPGEPHRYEVAGKGHHHHFSCRDCGRMFDFQGCPGDLSQLVPRGFTMEAHELTLYGRCDQCSDSQ
jgi:Fur family ferric uptake transcriptional regulator